VLGIAKEELVKKLRPCKCKNHARTHLLVKKWVVWALHISAFDLPFKDFANERCHFISLGVLSLSFVALHSMEKHKHYTHLDKTKSKTARKFPFSIIRQFTLLTKYLFPRISFPLYTVLKLKVIKAKKQCQLYWQKIVLNVFVK
jgi:hypothetical protein